MTLLTRTLSTGRTDGEDVVISKGRLLLVI